jgi:tRNA (cmo5U34)-methyltransferase
LLTISISPANTVRANRLLCLDPRRDYNASLLLMRIFLLKDTIYADNDVAASSFEFDSAVAGVFPDMLKRSIPGYAASIQAIGTLAARHAQAGTRCYDLGCSLGAATLAIRQNISVPDCRIIAVDNAPAMVERCRAMLAADKSETDVSILEADVRQIQISRASMVVMNYTLQFLPVDERAAMISKIHAGMVDDGVFVLSEKVVDEDPQVEKLLVGLHHEFKRRNAYSDLEISRKRAALENVLIPDTVAAHKQRLTDAGFRHTGIWLRYFNFISIVAIK